MTGNQKILAKICGLRDATSLECAVQNGASWVGFVFFPKSPRNISIEDAAKLAAKIPLSSGVETVGLFVDADDAFINQVLEAVPLDYLQLHGKESPERAAELKARTGRKIIKALAISKVSDFDQLAGYEGHVDKFLFDAKPPKGATRPGGNAVSFDWNLLSESSFNTPWMLAGGLTPDNVDEAIKLSGANAVDVSSGVEASTGIKDLDKIAKFLENINI